MLEEDTDYEDDKVDDDHKIMININDDYNHTIGESCCMK